MSTSRATLSRRTVLASLGAVGAAWRTSRAFAEDLGPRVYIGTDGRVRAAVKDAAKTSVFLTIFNTTEQDDVLLDVTCPWAERATFQRTHWQGLKHTQIVVDEVPIPAKSRVAFKAGQLEIRLEHPTRAFKPGLRVPLVLRFRDAGAISVEIEVFNRLL